MAWIRDGEVTAGVAGVSAARTGADGGKASAAASAIAMSEYFMAVFSMGCDYIFRSYKSVDPLDYTRLSGGLNIINVTAGNTLAYPSCKDQELLLEPRFPRG
jgi:hypothetical protein